MPAHDDIEPAGTLGETEGAERRAAQPLFVLKEGDMFLVADASGDVSGEGDGLFSNDTRVVSRMQLTFAGARPSLLSSGVSDDNVLFTAHLTNRPLPLLGESGLPEGLIHLERRRLLWEDRVFERITLQNYGRERIQAPLRLDFGADFRDMFEVRGVERRKRGTIHATEIGPHAIQQRYDGLDGVTRHVIFSFSGAPDRVGSDSVEFTVAVDPGARWELFVEIGSTPAEPDFRRYRAAWVHARRVIRQRRRRGARVRASGRLFQAWIDRSRADLDLLTTELPTGPYPYAGIPWFSTPFGRDAVITALQTLWLDAGLARGVLAFLATHQSKETSAFRDAEPGKIMHERRRGEMAAVDELPFARYYGGVDTTPLFIVLAGAYAERTADRAFIDWLWPSLEAAAGWIVGNADRHADGFLAYARGELSGLLNQGWKDSHDSVFHADGRFPREPIAIVEVQGYAFRAFATMAELAEWRGDAEAAAGWRARADALRAAVERRFWMDDAGFYALALDGDGEPCRVRASNAGHLLYVGLPSQERGEAVAHNLLARDFSSGWGVRTLARGSVRFNPMSYHNGSVWPHDVALCAAGMSRYGDRDGAVRVMSDLFEAAIRFRMRLPELFCGFERVASEGPIAYPVACLPQAWASGSAFMLLQSCLGIQIDARRREIRIDRPRLPPGIGRLAISRIDVGGQRVDLLFEQVGPHVAAAVDQQVGGAPVEVIVRS
jgi:glycogen debranching enzyme